MLADYLSPGHSNTRLLDAYPGVIQVAAVKLIPEYPPKMAVYTREYPDMFPS